jgi:hypothetical protein
VAKIELESDPKLGFCKVYPMSLKEQDELDMFLEEALSTGHIHLSKSPIGMLVFFIKKKDGKLHFVQDYCSLNVITRKNRYPLLLVDDVVRVHEQSSGTAVDQGISSMFYTRIHGFYLHIYF